MIASLRNVPKPLLDNFFIKNFLQSPEHNGKHLYLNQDDANKKSHMDEERLQEWRSHMFQIRNARA